MSASTVPTSALRAMILQTLVETKPTPWLPSPKLTSVSLLADGMYHVNFLVKSSKQVHVARYNRRSQWGLTSSAQLAREFAVLQDLSSSGVSPIPIALFADAESPFLVESYVSGEFFQHGKHIALCADAIAQAHLCAPVKSRQLLGEGSAKQFLITDGLAWLKKCTSARTNRATLAVLAEAAERLREAEVVESPPVLLHTDLIQKNILVSGSTCTLIDWEGARIGSRAWDLAYFLSPVTQRWADPPLQMTSQKASEFLNVYARTANVDPSDLAHEVHAMLPLVLFRALSWCTAYAEKALDVSASVAERLELFTNPGFVKETLSEALS